MARHNRLNSWEMAALEASLRRTIQDGDLLEPASAKALLAKLAQAKAATLT